MIASSLYTHCSKVIDLSLTPGVEQITLSWEAPPTSFNNEVVVYDDEVFENNIFLSTGEAIAGTYFAMPLVVMILMLAQ